MQSQTNKKQSREQDPSNKIFSVTKSHRKQLSQASRLSQDNQDDQAYVKKRGFSSQYLNLTKKFKVKLLNQNNTQKSINFGKVAKLRIKTQQNEKNKIQQLKQIIKKKSSLTPISFVQIESKKDSCRSHAFASQGIKTKNISFFKKSRYSPMVQPLNHSQNKCKINSLRKQQKDNLISTRIKSFLNTNTFEIVQEETTINHILKAIPHVRTLLSLYQLSRSQIQTQKDVCKKLKQYVFSQQKQTHSISFIDNIFKNKNQRQNIRVFIFYERLTIICFIDLLSHGKLAHLLQQAKIILQLLLGIYLKILHKCQQTFIVQKNQNLLSQILKTVKILQECHIVQKLSCQQVISNLSNRCYSLYRFNKQLYGEFSSLIINAKTLTINRAFYQLLSCYAIYLTDHQQIIAKNYGLINYFATCPSPYLLSKNTKKYSLVVDLDQTLLHSRMKNGKYMTQYRPGAFQFIQDLSAHYQIIIFTSAIKQYANQVVKPFKGISYILYRHHVTRLKGSIIKDISRLGRPLNLMLLIDDLQINFKLQPQNGIKVSQWKGDSNDKQLFVLKDLLQGIGKQQKHQDLRKVVRTWKFQSKNL